MCGFAGFLGRGVGVTYSDRELTRIAIGMSQRIAHRGPDDSGVWVDQDAQIALSFRRLAILDLTAAGHQPMQSPNGSFVISFNGEIYNHKDVLRDLESGGGRRQLRGHSDTEVLAAGFEEWGVAQTLRRCVGMFAIAAWDKRSRRLLLARDRFGEKPLYFGITNGFLLFGSELSALELHPLFNGEIDREALASFTRVGYVPAPNTIYREIQKLEPGTIISFSAEDVARGRAGKIERFWSAEEAAQQGLATPFEGSDENARRELEEILTRTVHEQMVADVPVGAFLSGGVDSSLVVALMQSQSARKIKTFSIGFYEDEFNEAPHAHAVASHLGTDHTELYISGQDALDIIPKMPHVYDEPFADSSQIPTYIVSKLARTAVTVSLSGDGGDEVFGGYSRYQFMQKAWRLVSIIPSALRRPIGQAISALPPIKAARQGSHAHMIRRVCQVFSVENFDQAYRNLNSSWNDSIVLGLDPARSSDPAVTSASKRSLLRRMMLTDICGYLPDDILVKVDRATMHFGLESRSPLLDHRALEFAMRLPDHLLLRNGVSKWLLREILYRHVPRALIDRPKRGFSIPLNEWLRGPLREWADDLLDRRKLSDAGFIDPHLVNKAWLEHIEGGCKRGAQLWNILMFQAWLQRSASAASTSKKAA